MQIKIFDIVMNQTVAFHTLGCKLNFAETSSIGRSLEAEGFIKKDFEDLADIYVINTCSVTNNADKECRQLVRRIKRRAADSMVVIIGCYAQLKPKEISEIEGVDMVLGAAEKFNLAHHVKQFNKGDDTKICSCDIDEVSGFNASYSIGDRTRTFLKVQDGCDYNCSFCTIPLARGHSRSDTISNVIANVKDLAKQGTKEIVLTGINLGDFGKGDQGSKKVEETFLDLIKALDALDDIERYRISSIEPNLLTHEIIDFVANSKHFMPHFHIPLQSGDNEVLGNMRRRYKKELYTDRVQYIKEKMPHCCIGVDVIVGFPGETDDHFENTRTFLRDLDVSYFHVFTYSERANTLAAEMDQVPMEVRHRRNKQLRNLSYKKMMSFEEQHRGETRPVLFEYKNKNGILEGYTDNYIRVQAAYKDEIENSILDWMV
ncbi:MAG TPA: tRNA (N(6)-L-threonylcarbamoyladenosine(37)-C(2))-methylthiotransferase MtaB [Edaphocola sp.]|nr:tRNA (N(6)-L-threonylcarbamoyladenosine(37)-C(2))-methylthiotransferase MtaB [Edaphocola sp.]